MTREQLEHIIRAAADIADDDEIVIVGSQAVLGQFQDAPASMLLSNEADIYPRNKPERADLIDGSIGEGSPFHDTYGYYAQGVDEGTAVLPAGWTSRWIAIRNANTRGAVGWCPELHDLLLAKAVAGRQKDERFLRCAAEAGLAREQILVERLDSMTLSEELRDLVRARVLRAFRSGPS